MDYQWECANKGPKKDIDAWENPFGPKVISRNPNGTAKEVEFRVLVDNPASHVYLVGAFNEWGRKLRREDKLTHGEHSIFASIRTDKLKHGDPYKLRLSNILLQDPASPYFDRDGNSIFYDYNDPSVKPMQHAFIDTHMRSTKIIQTDLPGLITHYADRNGICGRDLPRSEYYRFIATSGVLKHIRDLGFNTIQFLPFSQSIDGDAWKYRYLAPFPFAIKNEWGSIDEFRMLIDACHAAGIAVIADVVIGHFPYRDYAIFSRPSSENGLHLWEGRSGHPLYMKETTEWGTMRPDLDNPYVREFLIASCLHLMQRYRIDGFRIDNVDGILRHGENGQGDERKHGRTFLRELAHAVYAHNPHTLIHFESHYFKDDNAKMLVAPLDSDERALGATAYTSSRITYYFHTEYMLKSADKITPWKFKHITEEKEWGKSNSTIADFHNHDAAAGLMHERCTGSYAYDALTVNPYNHFHAIGKIKVMEAIISFCCEGRTLDLMQTFLLQPGTFDHDSSIQWQLTYNQVNRGMVEYKKTINEIMDDSAFWPTNTKHRSFLNVDDQNKVLVVERRSEDTRYVIVINLSAAKIYDYRVGVRTREDYEVVFNADYFEYAGFGITSYPSILENQPSTSFEVLDREVILGVVAPYGIVVLKAKE